MAALIVSASPAFSGGVEISGAVQVIDGDSVQVDGRRLHLYGITAPTLDNECRVAGKIIACGRVSRSALLDLTAGATVDCNLIGDGGDGPEPAAICRAGGYDLLEGMTYTGWARADPTVTEAYLRFETDTKGHHRGLWRKAGD